MHELVGRASYTKIVRCRGGVAETARERDLEMDRKLEHTSDLLLDSLAAEDTEYLNANAKRLSREPHVLHDTTEADKSQHISFRGRRSLVGVIKNKQQTGRVL